MVTHRCDRTYRKHSIYRIFNFNAYGTLPGILSKNLSGIIKYVVLPKNIYGIKAGGNIHFLESRNILERAFNDVGVGWARVGAHVGVGCRVLSVLIQTEPHETVCGSVRLGWVTLSYIGLLWRIKSLHDHLSIRTVSGRIQLG
jgi:hypothetical protein